MEIFNKKFLKKNKIGFTLVELIIVITILAILATIAFISFQGYSKNARDGNRLATLKNIDTGLQVYKTQVGTYPMTEDYIEVLSSGATIGYQGYFGDISTRLLKMSKLPADPLDQTRLTYTLNDTKTSYQLLTFLETSDTITMKDITDKIYADNMDYANRIPKTIGNEMGILLGNTGSDINRPLQDFKSVSFTGVDILTYTGGVVAIISNKEKITNSGSLYGGMSLLSGMDINFRGTIEIVMVECPSGWTETSLYKIPNGNAGTACNKIDGSGGGTCRICQAKLNTIIPKNSELVMPECSTGFVVSSTYAIPAGNAGTACNKIDGSGGGNCKVCTTQDDLILNSGNEVLMPSCSRGFSLSSVYTLPGGNAGTSCKSGKSCQVCKKN